MSNFFKASDLDTSVVERNTCGHCKKEYAGKYAYFCKYCMIEMQLIIHYSGNGKMYRKIWLDYLEDV